MPPKEGIVAGQLVKSQGTPGTWKIATKRERFLRKNQNKKKNQNCVKKERGNSYIFPQNTTLKVKYQQSIPVR